MRSLIPTVTLAAAALLGGCGSSGAAADSAQVAPSVASGGSAASNAASGAAPAAGGSGLTCFTADDVKSALGFEARSLTGGMRNFGTMSMCGFVATDDAKLPGVTVTATISPASDADTTFDQMRTVVKVSKGEDAQPDPIQVGERGLAYGTNSQARAAAVANGKLYSVQTGFAAVSNFGDKKDGVTELLRKLMGS
jgi:hypothetical protein